MNDISLLEPDDWELFRQQAHQALDVALDFASQRPMQPVWQEMPDQVKRQDDPLPEYGSSQAKSFRSCWTRVERSAV